MKTWHFSLALTIGVYAYVLLPNWVGMALAVSGYVMWQELVPSTVILTWWNRSLIL